MIKIIRTIGYSLSLCLFWSFACEAQVKIAPIGEYDELGKVNIVIERLSNTFPDGGPIEEVTVKNNNGFLYLVRRGYDNNGVCRTDSIELVDSIGSPLTVGSDPLSGTEAFLKNTSVTHRQKCFDNGCVGLKNTNILGQPIQSAFCDATEASNFQCGCHLSTAVDKFVIPEGEYCNSNITQILNSGFNLWLNKASCWLSKIQSDRSFGIVVIIPC